MWDQYHYHMLLFQKEYMHMPSESYDALANTTANNQHTISKSQSVIIHVADADGLSHEFLCADLAFPCK